MAAVGRRCAFVLFILFGFASDGELGKPTNNTQPSPAQLARELEGLNAALPEFDQIDCVAFVQQLDNRCSSGLDPRGSGSENEARTQEGRNDKH